MAELEKDALMREVDDEVRREKLQQFWKHFGAYVVSASVLIVILTVGLVGWQSYLKAQRAEVTSQLLAAQRAEEEDRTEEAKRLFAKVAASTNSDLSPLAHARLQQVLMHSGAPLQKLEMKAADRKEILPWYAAMLGADRAALSGLQDSDNPFFSTARELLALKALEENDTKEATKLLTAIRDDATTPATMKERAELLLSTLTGEELHAPAAR